MRTRQVVTQANAFFSQANLEQELLQEEIEVQQLRARYRRPHIEDGFEEVLHARDVVDDINRTLDLSARMRTLFAAARR